MKKLSVIIILLFLTGSCKKIDLIISDVEPVIVQADSIRFAVLGDYGDNGSAEQKVSDLIKSWDPEFIITTGDNNYSKGKESTLNENIGHYYCDYIYNYDAPNDQRCNGEATQEMQNRFFPSPGNHDFNRKNCIIPYLNYFTLPGEEDYYEFQWGPVHFFSICSGEDGNWRDYEPKQYNWLKSRLEESTLPWKLVYFHHSPYSTANHGSNGNMQWPFKEWGASAVLTGHDHVYSRVVHDAFPYFINGLGGRSSRYGCNDHTLDEDSFDVFCYNDDYGAMLVTADPQKITFKFYSIDSPDVPVDEYVMEY